MTCSNPDYQHPLGDTVHPLTITLSDAAGTFDASGMTVTLQLTHRKTRAVETFAMTAVTDGSDGQFTRDWSDGAPSAAGDYDARYIATAGGETAYFPTVGYALHRYT